MIFGIVEAILRALAEHLNDEAFEQALAWFKINDPEALVALQTQRHAIHDPGTDLTSLLDRIDSDRIERQYGGIKRLACENPIEALKQAEALEEGPDKHAVLEFVERIVFEKEPDRLVAKVEAMAAGKERDLYIQRQAMRSLRDHPAQAVEVLGLMSDQRNREQMTRSVMQRWLLRDPKEGRAALEASALPESIKRALLPKP